MKGESTNCCNQIVKEQRKNGYGLLRGSRDLQDTNKGYRFDYNLA
jgi:hypothetical protein